MQSPLPPTQSPAAQSQPQLTIMQSSSPPTSAPPHIPALVSLLEEMQQQNAKLLARVEALEASRSAQPHPTPLLPAPTHNQVEATVDAQFSTKIIPYVEKQLQKSSEQMTKLITDTAEQIVKLITERMSTLERTLVPDCPPQAKKARQPHDTLPQ